MKARRLTLRRSASHGSAMSTTRSAKRRALSCALLTVLQTPTAFGKSDVPSDDGRRLGHIDHVVGVSVPHAYVKMMRPGGGYTNECSGGQLDNDPGSVASFNEARRLCDLNPTCAAVACPYCSRYNFDYPDSPCKHNWRLCGLGFTLVDHEYYYCVMEKVPPSPPSPPPTPPAPPYSPGGLAFVRVRKLTSCADNGCNPLGSAAECEKAAAAAGEIYYGSGPFGGSGSPSCSFWTGSPSSRFGRYRWNTQGDCACVHKHVCAQECVCRCTAPPPPPPEVPTPTDAAAGLVPCPCLPLFPS